MDFPSAFRIFFCSLVLAQLVELIVQPVKGCPRVWVCVLTRLPQIITATRSLVILRGNPDIPRTSPSPAERHSQWAVVLEFCSFITFILMSSGGKLSSTFVSFDRLSNTQIHVLVYRFVSYPTR